MDKTHEGIYPFQMAHTQERTLNLTQRLISLELARGMTKLTL